MMHPDKALALVLNTVPILDTENIALTDSLGRIIADDICAARNIPAFDNSAMDGFAILAQNTHGATLTSPKSLKVIANQPAGAVTSAQITSGTAIRIMTGAPMPEGADAVVMVEDTWPAGENILIKREAAPGMNIRKAGEDVQKGGSVIAKGTQIAPAQMGMLAALGKICFEVYRRPRVAIITTGSELVDPTDTPKPGQIRDSNHFSLMGQVLRSYAKISYVARVNDDQSSLKQALTHAASASDLIITSGGVSVGDFDLVKETLAELGKIEFWSVAIKPGKPLAFGQILGCPVFGLPGNPVSSMVTFDLFVRPALSKISGMLDTHHKMVSATISHNIKHKTGRQEYIRCKIKWEDGAYIATPTGDQGSARLSSMLDADGYALIPENKGNIKAGDKVELLLLN